MTEVDFKEMVAKATAIYEAMTPEQKADHDYEQRRSFAKGMCPSNRDYAEYCAAVDRLLPPLKR